MLQSVRHLLGADHASSAEVSNFGLHGRSQEDVPRGEVAMDDGRLVAVQVNETSGNIQQDGALDGELDVGLRLEEVGKVVVQLLHHQIKAALVPIVGEEA